MSSARLCRAMSPELMPQSGINSLTSTHFDPAIFLDFPKRVVVSHRVNEPIYLAYGTSFRVRPEKGNTGGHGASQGQENGGE